MAEDATRKDRRDQGKQNDDLTPLMPAVVISAVDVPPASASVPMPAADSAPGWDSGFGGGDTGGAGGGGDF